MPKKLKRIKKSSKKQSKIDENRSEIGPGGLLGGLLGHLGSKSQHSSENPGSRAAFWPSSSRVKSIKIDPRWSPTSIDFSTYLWDRFFIDFGVILGSKMEPKSMKNRCWKGLIFSSIFDLFLSRIWTRFSSILKLMLKKRKCQKCNTY